MNYQDLTQRLNERNITLVAVSKTQPVERVLDLYRQGQRIFGENKVQEMCAKQPELPSDIEWHLIGHLQRNKVKYIAPFVRMIQSVDSLELLVEIDKQAQKQNRVIDCLLQFHIAQEETKFGLDEAEADDLIARSRALRLNHARICGVMGMASFTDQLDQVRREFDRLKQIFDLLAVHAFAGQAHFKHISMGMSGDWEIAADAGSTMVRIGSLLFGARTT